ncbi:MAG: hypothetical protein OHK0029_01760 [Armatimonadaceae bacterium]
MLGEDIPIESLGGVSVLIHCAYDFDARTREAIWESNVEGTRKLISAAQGAGVSRIIFISSVSAYDGCESWYGQAKLEIEQEMFRMGQVVVRPGLVYGQNSDGLVGAMQRAVSGSPLIPLIGSGRYKQCLTHIDDLTQCLLNIAESSTRFEFPITAASRRLFTLREIIQEFATAANRKPLLVPLDWRLIWLGLKTLETLGAKPKFRSDSVIGAVKYNPNLDFRLTDQVGVQFRDFQASELM